MPFPNARDLFKNHLHCFECGWSGKTNDTEQIITLAPAGSPRKYKCPKCGKRIINW